jgi:hypothetical protein
MSTEKRFAPTPCYMLKSGKQAIYPTIDFDDPVTHCVCVYGFSGKPIYDKFIQTAGQLLTPYPLVQGYLSNQVAVVNSAETKGDCLGLVILDATDLAQPVLSAATMATVLLAHQEKAKQVSIEYEFVFDPGTAKYQISNEFETAPMNHKASTAK